MTNYDVTENRSMYIGGSDIPAVMDISPFKKRFDLLKEKAGIQLNDFRGNAYTEYGVKMEPKIRDFINHTVVKKPYEQDRLIDGDCRYHSDGFNGKSVLEIKTTSQIHDEVHGYKQYLVQLLFGMQMHDVKEGLLAVYERPDDWNEEFDLNRLTMFSVDIKEEQEIVDEITSSLESFREDLAYLKEHPFSEESDLPSRWAVVPIAEKVAALELKLNDIEQSKKELDKESKEARKQLCEAMEKHGIKKWETPNGTKLTLIEGTEDKEIDVFDDKTFAADHPRLWKKYQVKTKKKGRAGYVRITLPKTAE